jgi:hypothetical protein
LPREDGALQMRAEDEAQFPIERIAAALVAKACRMGVSPRSAMRVATMRDSRPA